MAKFYDKIPPRIQEFIKKQKVFFVATAAKEGRINLSPKGMDSFRILDENTIACPSTKRHFDNQHYLTNE